MPVYGVAGGGIPGVYEDWESASKAATGHKGAKVKKFATREEAANFASSSLGTSPTLTGAQSGAPKRHPPAEVTEPKEGGVVHKRAKYLPNQDDDGALHTMEEGINLMSRALSELRQCIQGYRGALFDATSADTADERATSANGEGGQDATSAPHEKTLGKESPRSEALGPTVIEPPETTEQSLPPAEPISKQ